MAPHAIVAAEPLRTLDVPVKLLDAGQDIVTGAMGWRAHRITLPTAFGVYSSIASHNVIGDNVFAFV